MTFSLKLASEPLLSEPDDNFYVHLAHPWVDDHRIVEEWGFATEEAAQSLYNELHGKYIEPINLPHAPKNGSLDYDTEKDLQYNYGKVGTFKVKGSKLGRSVWFTPSVDSSQRVTHIYNLKRFLEGLVPEGVSFKFHNAETCAYMVTVPPNYSISEILKRTAEAYAIIYGQSKGHL